MKKWELHILYFRWNFTVILQKSTGVIVSLWANLPTFLTEYYFYLKEQLTENRQTILFRLGYLRTTYLKATKYTRAFKENNWQYLLPMITYELSSKSQNFGKTHKHHWELDSFSIIKDFSDEIGGEMNKYKGLHCIKKCVNIWKIFITWINSF